jgi:hypothetical protein
MGLTYSKQRELRNGYETSFEKTIGRAYLGDRQTDRRDDNI